MAPILASSASSELRQWHFTHPHPTIRRDLPSKFECDLCGIAGIGRRHECTRCGVVSHAYCHKCPKKEDCCLHPFDSAEQKHRASREKIENAINCTVCGDEIRAGMFFYSCERDPNCFSHLPCFLIQKTTKIPDEKCSDYMGHALERYKGLRYSRNCATCGKGGFGRFLRGYCETRGKLNHHPFCINSSNRPHRDRVCFRHHDDDHKMAWTEPPPSNNKIRCALCDKDISGYYYRCCDINCSESREIHPMCTEILRQDRKYNQIAEVVQIVGGLITLNIFNELPDYMANYEAMLIRFRTNFFIGVTLGGLLAKLGL